MNEITDRKTEEEMVRKIESFDKGTLRAMLYSIKDISLLQELIKIGDDFHNATIIANKRKTEDKTNDVKTTEKYWDCECKDNFIHPRTQSKCTICGALAEEQPDSRINEVLMFGFLL